MEEQKSIVQRIYHGLIKKTLITALSLTNHIETDRKYSEMYVAYSANSQRVTV